ncbi:MAG: type I 3-dehydroquinate dehydratase [Chitinispirillia bacterium]|nr:type I 3-dehydroquinate dehydratase [Chitinispirillia bacterium]MCL2241213.1 type I 3-dehydroquinate dehydratase [Chitinispirillia bacterium]
MKIKMGKLELGAVPRVAGIVDYRMPPLLMSGLVRQGVDIFEIRADLFGEPVDAVIEYIERVREEVQAPLIGTIRENGVNCGLRAEWLARLARYVDCVDIELGVPWWRSVVDSVPADTLVMVSEHDFSGTPDLAGLNGIVERALAQKADIIKIAAMANCAADVTRLLRFTEDCGEPLVSVSMGPLGSVSRTVAPLFGSLFTYGYLNKAVAPGQFSAEKVIAALNDYFPGRGTDPLLNRAGAK